ncbi:MAG: tetratricopeptide repeat protein [Acidobacteriota bacterium]
MNDSIQIRTNDPVESRPLAASALADRPISVRVSPSGYLIAVMLVSFFSAFFFYLEIDAAGIALFCLAWLCIPFLALTDRIGFDGKRLSRSGIIPRVWTWFQGGRRSLKLNDIEQIETAAVRTFKRGGNVIYRYRTTVRGKDMQISFASGSDNYRRMIAAILPRVAENALDARSIDLRDHLADPKETLMKAEFEHIPSAEVLGNATRGIRTNALAQSHELGHDDVVRVEYLRKLANELRLNGYLRQSLEAFRRALVLKPHDGRILFEFARCVQSFAGAERSSRLERKAIAAMRLAEMRANDDGDLLERLGEAYFQAGEWRRASAAFQKALDRVGEGYRSARGLAEIALREGKIAHVIHHFSTANRLAQTPSLRRWTRSEAEYFARLNDDDEYMEMEVGRVSLLETFESVKRTALRLTFMGFPVIFLGMLTEDDMIADTGWAVSAVTLLIWAALNIATKMFATRIPYDMLGNSDD